MLPLFCTGSGLTVPIACGLKYLFTCSGPCRCQRALPVCRPRVLALLRCGVHEFLFSLFCGLEPSTRI